MHDDDGDCSREFGDLKWLGDGDGGGEDKVLERRAGVVILDGEKFFVPEDGECTLWDFGEVSKKSEMSRSVLLERCESDDVDRRDGDGMTIAA